MKKVVFEPDTCILMHWFGLRVVSQRKNEQIAIPPPTFGWFLWSWIFLVFCDFFAMKSHFIGSLCNWIVSQSCFKIQMNSYIQHVLNNWLWVMINSFPKQHELYQFHIQAATLILRWTTQIKELLAEAGLFSCPGQLNRWHCQWVIKSDFWFEQSRAEQSRAERSGAEQSRAEQSKITTITTETETAI